VTEVSTLRYGAYDFDGPAELQICRSYGAKMPRQLWPQYVKEQTRILANRILREFVQFGAQFSTDGEIK
jgi:hypothetical protein